MISQEAQKISKHRSQTFVKTLQIHFPFFLNSNDSKECSLDLRIQPVKKKEKMATRRNTISLAQFRFVSRLQLLFYRGNKSANYSRPRDSLLPSCPPAIKLALFHRRLLLLVFVFHARNFAKFKRIRDFSSRRRWNRIEGEGEELFRSWEILFPGYCFVEEFERILKMGSS